MDTHHIELMLADQRDATPPPCFVPKPCATCPFRAKCANAVPASPDDHH